MDPKFEQIAWYVNNISLAKANLASRFGMRTWVDDEVTGYGTIWGTPAPQVRALLAFNYDLGFEYELLTYPDEQCWHFRAPLIYVPRPLTPLDAPFLSHVGYHVDDVQAEREARWPDFVVAQDLTTVMHTNRYVLEHKRRYRYVVMATRAALGYDVKLIQRLTVELEA